MSEENRNRRSFVKETSLLAASTAAFPLGVHGQSTDDRVRVALVGCGGRGTGATSQVLVADDRAAGDVGGFLELGRGSRWESDHMEGRSSHSSRFEGGISGVPTGVEGDFRGTRTGR